MSQADSKKAMDLAEKILPGMEARLKMHMVEYGVWDASRGDTLGPGFKSLLRTIAEEIACVVTTMNDATRIP